jgi:hypothetical protein
MVMVKTREWEIANLEKFEIHITHPGGKRLNSTGHGLEAFGYKKSADGNLTVKQWKENRFIKVYPRNKCKVLMGNGTEANGGTKLKNLRESYRHS